MEQQGYFQVLYEGKSMMLKKEEKVIRELASFSADEKVKVIDTRSVYYLRKGDHLFRIDNRVLWPVKSVEMKLLFLW